MILSKVWGELALYQSLKATEYPPFAYWLFKLANVAGEKWFTLIWYGMVAVSILLIVLLIKKLKGNPYIFLAAILPLGGLLWDRFDIFPAMFSLLAIYLATTRFKLFAFNALCIAVLLKVYPILLLPVLIGMFLKRKAFVELGFGLIFFLIPLVVANWDFMSFHKDRGIQIESIRAIPKLLNKNSIIEYKHNTMEIR